jgi:hypothetical protein
MMRAGLRLAAVLNQTVGGAKPTKSKTTKPKTTKPKTTKPKPVGPTP